MKRNSIISTIIGVCISATAQNMDVIWHNEASDTTRIARMLVDASSQKFTNPSERVIWFGQKFIDTPYVAHTLECPVEALTVNIDELDCTTFVETALALAATSAEGRLGWQDYIYHLRNMRYRGGDVNGYSSRLHYICDWATDNIHRGAIADLTPNLDKCKYAVRSIDFMSHHADKYPALKDSLQLAKIKSIEGGYRNHRFPYIKPIDLNAKSIVDQLREGDILAFVSNLPDLDVTHMGMLVKGNDGKFHVLHASSTNGKVEVSKQPLQDFVRRNRSWIGVRIFRLKN